MMDNLRCPNAIAPSGSSHTPASSGPRWAIVPAIRHTADWREPGAQPLPSLTIPAIPHTANNPPLTSSTAHVRQL